MADFRSSLNGKEIEKSLKDIYDYFGFRFNGRKEYDLELEPGDYDFSMFTGLIEKYPEKLSVLPRKTLQDFFDYNFLGRYTQFYVNASTGVDDMEHGLSPDKPWKTLYYAAYHLPHLTYNTVTLNVAAGTYNPYFTYNSSYTNDYIVAVFENFINQVNIVFAAGTVINGELLFQRATYVVISGSATFNLKKQNHNNTNTSSPTLASYAGMIIANFWTVIYFNAPTLTLNGVNTASDGYYIRGIGAFYGARIIGYNADTPLVTINNCCYGVVAQQQGYVFMRKLGGSGNTYCLGAWAGGCLAYTTQGIAGTTAIAAGGGGRVYNGGMESNGRY